MYVQITRCTVTYMERKIVYGIDLLAIYDKFRGATDPMPGHLFDLDLGDMLLAEVKYKGKLAVGLQKQLESAYNRYFDDHGSLSSADMTRHPHMVTAYTPGFIFQPKLSMASIRAQMRAGTLHMSCCSERYPTFQQWSDVQEPLKVMSTFRQDLRSFTPDETIMSSRKADAVKAVVTITRAKMLDAEQNPDTQDVYAVQMLCVDLEKLAAVIFTVDC